MEEDIKFIKYYMEQYFYEDIAIEDDFKFEEAIKNLLTRYKQLEEENKQLREYIVKEPKLDEITAVQYTKIQEEAYIMGRAKEQQRAKEIIHNYYIPKPKAIAKIEEYNKREKEELKGMKGQDRYFVKQMYNYMRKPLEELLREE